MQSARKREMRDRFEEKMSDIETAIENKVDDVKDFYSNNDNRHEVDGITTDWSALNFQGNTYYKSHIYHEKSSFASLVPSFGSYALILTLTAATLFGTLVFLAILFNFWCFSYPTVLDSIR